MGGRELVHSNTCILMLLLLGLPCKCLRSHQLSPKPCLNSIVTVCHHVHVYVLCHVYTGLDLLRRKELREIQSSSPYSPISHFTVTVLSPLASNEVQLPAFLSILSLASYTEGAGTTLGCCFKKVAAKKRQG